MKTFIIAEIGINHNGSLRLAKKMIDLAAKTGADGVKFQTYKTENLVTQNAPKTKYQINNLKGKKKIFHILKKCEFSEKDFKLLKKRCKKKKIEFLSSAFDLDSIKLLKKLGLNKWKIPSGEINNYPYLKEIGKINKEIMLSTGMSNLEEIKTAMKILQKSGTNKKKITILHCSTDYPAKYHDLNLKALITMKKKFRTKIGYSDHSLGIEVPIAATAMGAQVIEKHFTLNKNMKGVDHKASLDFKEFKNMVLAIRNIESALGSYNKILSFNEKKNLLIVRKSIVASKNIKKGEVFSNNNITTKRPGYGLSPMQWNKLKGKKSKKNFKKDQFIII